MQVVILAGGLGSRLSEETDVIPKPMIEIGKRPILWHLIDFFASQGLKEIIVATGYKSEIIESFVDSKMFHNYSIKAGVDVKCVFTGENSLTGTRLYKLKAFMRDEFIVTYGDGLTDMRIDSLIKFHRRKGKVATVTAVHPPARFGSLKIKNDLVLEFDEKNPQKEGWINGGFICTSSDIFNFIPNKDTSLESLPMSNLVSARELVAYKYEGWWYAMDTIRDKRELQRMWDDGTAPWNK